MYVMLALCVRVLNLFFLGELDSSYLYVIGIMVAMETTYKYVF